MLNKIKNLISRASSSPQEETSLDAIPRIPLDTAPLPHTSSIQMNSLINPTQTDEVWEQVKGGIEALNLPEFTGGGQSGGSTGHILSHPFY